MSLGKSQKLAASVFVLALTASVPASAITVEVAKACEAATSKAFPPRQIGNPAAGSAKGSSKDQRDYYNKCVANDGKADPVPADASKDSTKSSAKDGKPSK